jgi:putative oxidoreductase
MNRLLGRYAPYCYALVRIIAGLMFAMHGMQKLFGVPGGGPTVHLASMLGVAALIELVCGLLIAVGLFASWAAFIASGEMAAAYFMAHFPRNPLPILNQGEPAVLYCFIFLYIAFAGAGVWSLDSLIGQPRVEKEQA